MSDYRRCFIPGGCYFFTFVTYRRQPLFADAGNIVLLRDAFRSVKAERPFEIQTIVVLIHYNPVKHGYVPRAMDWAHSSFAIAVRRGWYPPDWGCDEPVDIRDWTLE